VCQHVNDHRDDQTDGGIRGNGFARGKMPERIMGPGTRIALKNIIGRKRGMWRKKGREKERRGEAILT